MSRSRRPKCSSSRKHCGVCTDCKQYGRRLRERERGKKDLQEGVEERADDREELE